MGFMDKVKEAADKFGGAVEKGVKTGSDGYKKIAEKSKLKKEIGQLESGITGVYTEIGKKFAAENPGSAEYAEFFESIAEKSSKLETLKAQLALLEDKITCTSCGASVSKDAKFCDKCGQKIVLPAVPVPEEDPESDEPVSGEEEPVIDIAETAEVLGRCRSCGAETEPGQKYCFKCGTKLD